MNILVAYYSLEGNSAYVAEIIAKKLNADSLRLTPKKEYPKGKITKYLWGGKSASMGESPKLEPYDFNVANYDLIILGTPVWANTFAPPLRTFIKENNLKGKKIAIYTTSTGGNASNCINKLKELISECEVTGEISIIDPLFKKDPEKDDLVIQFCEKIS